MSIWNYADRLPELDPTHRLTLGEGNTPLVRSRRVGPAIGCRRLIEIARDRLQAGRAAYFILGPAEHQRKRELCLSRGHPPF